MPYIVTQRRRDLDKHLLQVYPRSAGELNYAITCLVHNFLWQTVARRGDRKGGAPLYSAVHLRYDDLNAVVGVLDSAKAEFQRRVVGPFEDMKIERNGDI